ncbi:MAG: hypothetical protein PHC75_10000 [Burkholderiales bacterium]|nr:hypothetical protein [Burkholderiales bacterium]
MSENLSLLKKDDLIKIIENSDSEKLLKTIEEKDNQLNELNNKFNSLEKMILEMQIQNQNNSNTQVIKPEQLTIKNSENDIVKIGSCLIGRHFLCDNTGAEIIELEDVGDVASVSRRILDSLMTSRNKSLFKDGLIYFLNDDSLYERYSIKKNIILDESTIDSIYAMPINDMVKELNKLTGEGKNEKIKYSLYWAFVKNIASGKDGYNDKGKEMMLANYFKADINNSIGQLSYCKEIGYF